MKKIALTVTVGLALALQGGEKVVKNGDRIVFMGDSITQYGAERTHGYPHLVVKGLEANGISVSWVGAGIAGNTSSNMLERFDEAVVAKNPTVVTISAGVNDVCYHSVSYDQFCANEREMVARTQAAGARAVLLSPTTSGTGCVCGSEPQNEELRRFVNGVKQVAAETGAVYAPVFEAFRACVDDPDTPVQRRPAAGEVRATYDGCHMAPVGDRVIARATLRAFGLDLDELSVAEAAWNGDDSLVPLIAPPASSVTIAVGLSDGEKKLLDELTLKKVLDRGIASLAAKPAPEAEAADATGELKIGPKSYTCGFRTYDQLLVAARKLGVTVDEAVRCAVLRGLRDGSPLAPAAPVAAVERVRAGSTAATFDVTVSSVGATAGACDVFLRLGEDGQPLGEARRIAVGESGSFAHRVDGLRPSAAYAYEFTVRNNADEPQSVTVGGRFSTTAATGLIAPGGEDDTDALQAAIDAAVPDGEVGLDAGDFMVSRELCVTGGVRLTGRGWTNTTVRQVASDCRVATVDGGARLCGVTATGGRVANSWTHGAGLLVEDGTVSWCRVTGNSGHGYNEYGGGIHIAKGAIDHTIVDGNRSGKNSGGGGGIACRNGSGPVAIDACLVCGNCAPSEDGGGILFTGGNPVVTIRNTTVAGNSAPGSDKSGGGVSIGVSQVKLVNVLVAGNSAASGEADVAGTPATGSSNNLIGGEVGFADAARGDYRLAAGSPAIGAGAVCEGLALDLVGAPFANPPSIGCYEYDGAVKRPVELGEPSARPSTDYNGSAVSLSFTGDLPDGAAVSAKVTVGGVDYAGTVTGGTATFTLPSDVVTAGKTYAGAVTLTVGDTDYAKPVTLVQGRLVVDEKTDWIRETAANLNATGTWSGGKVAVEDGRISVSNAHFTAATPSRENAVVTVASTVDFCGANDGAFKPSSLGGVKVVTVGGEYRYAFLTGAGVVTNLETVASASGDVEVRARFDFAANEISYTVGGKAFGPFPGTAGARRVSGVGYDGEAEISSLDGTYRYEGIDANLAKVGGIEYATVAEALAAGAAAGSGPVTLLWDASWSPAKAGDYTVAKGGYSLVIGGDLVCSVKDNGDGTVTVTAMGGEELIPSSISVAGSTVRVGVKDAKPDLWYALEKTTDLTKPFEVDASTWTKGSDLIGGGKELVIALGDKEANAFYRVVASSTGPLP